MSNYKKNYKTEDEDLYRVFVCQSFSQHGGRVPHLGWDAIVKAVPVAFTNVVFTVVYLDRPVTWRQAKEHIQCWTDDGEESPSKLHPFKLPCMEGIGEDLLHMIAEAGITKSLREAAKHRRVCTKTTFEPQYAKRQSPGKGVGKIQLD